MQNKRADQRKHHIIYKTTCLTTGRWYIGMHSTDDLNDGYIGSGQVLWRSIKKYGKEQHQCEILEHLQDRKSLSVREEEILSKDLRADPFCMNVAPGGLGHHPGWYTTSKNTKTKLSETALKRWKREKQLRVEINEAAPFSMTREEIIAELVLPNGHLNKNATRNLKPRAIPSRAREAEVAKKWNFICKVIQNKNFPNATDLELINAYVHNITSRPTCKICSRPVTFFRFGQPYATYCGVSCQLKDPIQNNPVLSRSAK